MSGKQPQRVCVIPQVSGVGGMVSFRHKLTAGLMARGIAISADLADRPYEAVLVIGGSRQLVALWRARQRGIPVVQRLDGMNWLHRVGSRKSRRLSDWRHFLRAEYGNWILSTIRQRLATHIVYQSEFVVDWWERRYGAAPASKTVIYNGVDLALYSPHGPEEPPQDRWRLLMVEGSLMGGYEQGIQAAVGLAEYLVEKQSGDDDRNVELMIVGRVSQDLQRDWGTRLQRLGGRSRLTLVWSGELPRQRIPPVDRSAHLLYSADVNAACPNSVIEALACGLPVVAFDTGALPELVTGDAGRLAPYGGDPWQLETPDVQRLARAASEILADQPRFRSAARGRAEAHFGLDAMVEAYLEVLSLW